MREAGGGSPIIRYELLDGDFAESYRALHANIAFSEAAGRIKTVVVTSASSGEGKTTTTLNLAIVMAHAGRQVVVIDAGTGRPGIQDALCSAFGWQVLDPAAPGLAGVLAGTVSVDDAILTTPLERLLVLPRGSASRNPSELLGSERMRSVLERLSECADCVLVDTPPCIGYAGSWHAAQLADGVLYVVRAGSERTAQRQALARLQEAQARVLGVVFNDVDLWHRKLGRKRAGTDGQSRSPRSLLAQRVARSQRTTG